jgi:hypothetical protein
MSPCDIRDPRGKPDRGYRCRSSGLRLTIRKRWHGWSHPPRGALSFAPLPRALAAQAHGGEGDSSGARIRGVGVSESVPRGYPESELRSSRPPRALRARFARLAPARGEGEERRGSHLFRRLLRPYLLLARAFLRSSCSNADAMRSISARPRPASSADFRHVETTVPISAAIDRAS